MAKVVRDGLLSARSAIKRARAYNAQAKPIEGQFGNVTRFILPAIEGWVGGDRLTQPTKRQGQRAQHYTGDKLQAEMNDALAFYDNLPQSGHLNGKSPAAARDEQAAAGIERIDVNVAELIDYWSSEHQCVVRQGRIIIPKLGPYCGDFLHQLRAGTKVLARVPLAGDATRIAVYDEHNSLRGFAEPLERRHFLDRDGALSQRSRAAGARQAVLEMDHESAGFDPAESRRQFVAMHDVPADMRSAGVIQIDKTAKITAEARQALPAPSNAKSSSSLDVWLEEEESAPLQRPIKKGREA